jgi:hypothetical protein
MLDEVPAASTDAVIISFSSIDSRYSDGYHCFVYPLFLELFDMQQINYMTVFSWLSATAL